jgi:hypothetical protein
LRCVGSRAAASLFINVYTLATACCV